MGKVAKRLANICNEEEPQMFGKHLKPSKLGLGTGTRCIDSTGFIASVRSPVWPFLPERYDIVYRTSRGTLHCLQI